MQTRIIQNPANLSKELQVRGCLSGQQHNFLAELNAKLLKPVLVGLQALPTQDH